MASLFISGIPKTASVEDVESFLRQSFPLSTETLLLRTDALTHKGHAYIHFRSATDTTASASAYLDRSETLFFGREGPALRVRLSTVAPEAPLSSAPDKVPLPASYLDQRFSCCAVVRADTGDPTRLCELAQARLLPLPPLLPSHACAEDIPRVAAFASHAARELAVTQQPEQFIRCGPPRLRDLLAPCTEPAPRGTAAVPVARRKRGRDPSPSAPRSADPQRWSATGLTPLTPVEALRVVEDFFHRQDRVAFADDTGSLALLRLPSYAAGFL